MRLRTDIDEGETKSAEIIDNPVHGIVNLVSVVDLAGDNLHQRTQRFLFDILQTNIEVHIPESILVAFLHREGDNEILLVRRQLGDSIENFEVRIAFAQIVPPEQLTVEAETIGIIGVRGRQDAPEGIFLGLDHIAQLGIAESLVADKGDRPDPGQRPFINLEHQIDTVLL